MASRTYKIYEEQYPYFITCNLRFGLPLFSNPSAVAVMLENLQFLQDERQIRLIAYVIMGNHFHAILHGSDLTNKIGQFKSYSARRIIDLFRLNQHTRWLKRLKSLKPSHKSDSEFQLWEGGFHPKQIIGDQMMNQKINYIHQNPVKRGYVDAPEHWRYSSARNYAGSEGLISVDLFKGRAG